MAKFVTFVSEMYTRTVKYPLKQPIKRKVWLFELGSVTKFSPLNHMHVDAESMQRDMLAVGLGTRLAPLVHESTVVMAILAYSLHNAYGYLRRLLS